MSLQGTLSTLGITETLEFLASRSVTGRLDVTTEMGTAAFELLDGGVSKAEYSFMRESGVDAAEATYYVVSELDGTFFFDDELVIEPVEDGELPEDVGSLLSRTVEIAEKWADVEDVIPTPNHLLIRNEEIDGSVTIQPEWWKALQVIGDGQTSLQLATQLELGALDASLTALAMTNAGLLIVQEVDPLDIEIGVEEDVAPTEPAPEPPEFYAAPVVEEPELVETAPPTAVAPSAEPAPSFDTAPPADVPAAAVPEPAPEAAPVFQPVDMLEVVDIEDPTPPDEAPTGASGMDDLSSLEYMLESDGHVGPAPTSPDAQVAASEPVQPQTPETSDDDDGWSNGHSSGAAAFEPMAAPAAPPVEHTPVAESFAPAPDPVAPMSFGNPVPAEPVPETSSPFEAPAPAEPTPDAFAPMAFEAPAPAEPATEAFAPMEFEAPAPAEPMPEPYAAMDVADLPAPPPPLDEPTSATAMAGEVLDDLASMSTELDETVSTEANWQLDGTFVPEEAPEEPRGHADPFGDLGHLLEDESDSDRGSVLKFLRRD